MINDIDHKICKDCEEWFPSSTKYFYANKMNSLDGLKPYCKECTKKRSKKWRYENEEAYEAISKRWLQSEKGIESNKRRQRRRRESGKYREWQRSNPDKIRKYNLNRANKNHDISEEEWSACKEYFNNSCAYCGITEHNAIERFNNRLHKEHVVHDGSNRLDNCVPACKECNSSKHTSDFEVWYRETTFYTEERFNMIVRWLENDHKKYLKN